MSNTNIDALYPEFWAGAWDKLDIGKYGLQNKVSRDVEIMLANAGDTINVPITPDLGDADDWTPGDAITATTITQETAQVVLNKSKKMTIALTGKELSLTPYELIEKYGVPMAKTIIKAVNLDIYLELMKTDTWVDAISGIDENDIISCKTELSLNEITDEGRSLIVGPDDIDTLLKLDAFQHVNISGTNDAMVEGLLQRKFGFDIFENNIISKYTPTDVAGAIDNGAGYAIGATTIAVDAFNDDVNPIRAGDIFIIADESGTPYHTVISTTTTTSDTTGITFTPALTDATADDAVVTVTPTRSALGFVPSAAAFAARSYATLPSDVGVSSSVLNLAGLPIRISVFHDSKLGLNVQYDLLYGVKTVNSDRVCRILCAA